MCFNCWFFGILEREKKKVKNWEQRKEEKGEEKFGEMEEEEQ